MALLPMARTLDYYLTKLLSQKMLHKRNRFTLLERAGQRQWLWNMAIIIGIGLVFHFTSSQKNLRIGVSNFSPSIQAFIEENKTQFERPFTSTILAGNILYYFHPDIKVSFDDRVDFYGDKISYQFLDASFAKPGTEDFLKKYQFDSAILHKGEPLEYLLQELPDWTLSYEDQHTAIFMNH